MPVLKISSLPEPLLDFYSEVVPPSSLTIRWTIGSVSYCWLFPSQKWRFLCTLYRLLQSYLQTLFCIQHLQLPHLICVFRRPSVWKKGPREFPSRVFFIPPDFSSLLIIYMSSFKCSSSDLLFDVKYEMFPFSWLSWEVIASFLPSVMVAQVLFSTNPTNFYKFILWGELATSLGASIFL